MWPDIRVPCLVLGFEHDVDSPPVRAREAAAQIPGARFVEIAAASHLGPMTHVGPGGRRPRLLLPRQLTSGGAAPAGQRASSSWRSRSNQSASRAPGTAARATMTSA